MPTVITQTYLKTAEITTTVNKYIMRYTYFFVRVSHFLEAYVKHQRSSSGICSGQSGTGIGFPQSVLFPLMSLTALVLQKYSSIPLW